MPNPNTFKLVVSLLDSKTDKKGKCYHQYGTGGYEVGTVMFRFIFGILLGVVIVTYYPEIIETTASLFVDSGARDEIIELLEEVK